ncbi:MAG: hypothetical protein WC810_06000 [Janthinobacterium sp.]|jgi:hypothetical protein
MTNDSSPQSQESQVEVGAVAQLSVVARPVHKYSTKMATITKCPPKSNLTEIDVGYRFAFSNVADVRNFLPVAKISPHRTLPNGKKIVDCCSGWSLSMYTTLDKLQSRVLKTADNAPQFMKRVGDSFIKVKLTKACGEHTKPDGTGHFEFFERSTFDGNSAVVEHGKIFV